jgi:hypothetical protein
MKLEVGQCVWPAISVKGQAGRTALLFRGRIWILPPERRPPVGRYRQIQRRRRRVGDRRSSLFRVHRTEGSTCEKQGIRLRLFNGCLWRGFTII